MTSKIKMISWRVLQSASANIRRCASSMPDFSKNKYDVQRGKFNAIEPRHLEYFKGELGHESVLTDQSDLLAHNVDWIKNWRGESPVVLKPKSTLAVSNILKYCNDNNLAVCPQGGNTGLVGGSVPVFDEVIINMEKMNKILSVDDISGIMVCESGCILQNLDTHLREYGLLMPLDLGAKGSCQIGGNVSTNAGGLRLLRYGNLHGSILGLEAVLANGDVIDCLSTLRKDNTGYHLKHLFIGSEGSLGIVTKVSVHCPPLMPAVNVAFLGLNSFEDILRLYRLARTSLGEILSAFEMLDAASLDLSTTHLKLKNPIGDYPFYVLLETSGSNETHDAEKLSAFLENAMSTGLVQDGTTCSEPSRVKAIWDLRENISGALLYDGYALKYDFSLPIKEYYNIVLKLREKLKGEKDVVRVCGYGHIGDSNIHLNVSMKEYSPDIIKKIQPFVYECISEVKGSISAEHGVGFQKPKYLHYSKGTEAIRFMKDLKRMMDPKGILNPYKVLQMN